MCVRRQLLAPTTGGTVTITNNHIDDVFGADGVHIGSTSSLFTGTSTFNVGDGGEAFGVDDYSAMAIMDLLLATNDRSRNGVLYDMDGDGDADDDWETLLRTLANDVYSAINEQGHI